MHKVASNTRYHTRLTVRHFAEALQMSIIASFFAVFNMSLTYVRNYQCVRMQPYSNSKRYSHFLSPSTTYR